jgi:predicted transcriptional regulator of viral defense system
MDFKNELYKQIDKNNGILTTAEVTRLGIPRMYIQTLVKDGVLQTVERGVYCRSDCFVDEMYCLQTKYKRTIFSHDTALFLHNYTDRNPLQYSLTVPSGYNTKVLRQQGHHVYSIKKDLFTIGLCQRKTLFGRLINTYNIERTLCDVIRSRNQLDITVIKEALFHYAESDDKNIPLLMTYADQFRVSKLLSEYLRIIL